MKIEKSQLQRKKILVNLFRTKKLNSFLKISKPIRCFQFLGRISRTTELKSRCKFFCRKKVVTKDQNSHLIYKNLKIENIFKKIQRLPISKNTIRDAEISTNRKILASFGASGAKISGHSILRELST